MVSYCAYKHSSVVDSLMVGLRKLWGLIQADKKWWSDKKESQGIKVQDSHISGINSNLIFSFEKDFFSLQELPSPG